MLVASALFSGFATAADNAAEKNGADWPNWRGPQQNSTSLELGLVDRWDPAGGEGSNLLWKSDKLATRSTPIVMNGRLYTICRADVDKPTEGEKVVCANAETGQILWENRFNVYLSDVPGERVGWSNCVGDPETDRVYVLGVCGLFQCIDGKTGKTVWKHSMHEEFGLLSTYGGRTNTPILFEDMVLISAVVIGWGDQARPTHRFLAFDKRTGEVVWFNGTRPLPDDTTYSTPTVTVIDGQAAMVFGSGDGAIWAFQPRTGRPIWSYQLSRRGVNTSPLVADGVVYAAHSEENPTGTAMGALAAFDGKGKGDITKTGEKWRIRELMAGKASPVMLGGRIYMIDDGAKLFIVDAKTGKQIKRQPLGTVMRGTPLAADGKLYVSETNGRWSVLKPTASGVSVLHRLHLEGEECHGSPIVAQGKIYLPTLVRMYCIGTKDWKPALAKAPELPKEAPLDADAKPDHLQVVPAEVLMRPGETKQFAVRVFNSRGQLLKTEKQDAAYSLESLGGESVGEISADGKFTAPGSAGGGEHVAVKVVAKAAGLVGAARVRVVPDLPWKFSFAKEVPVTWVGMRYRHIIREVDKKPVMVKITTIPKGTRSQGFFGHPNLSNYTIQADVQGQPKDGKMPDIGMVAQGYILDLQGDHQKLQIRTWSAQPNRAAKTIDFPWKTGVWYTMKLSAAAETANGKPRAVVRAKVWPKPDKEPADWAISLTDESPNTEGSPGMFGNATNGEIFIDNVAVTPNP